MELAQLRALRELGDRGSIAAVAAALRVTPSSISQQISALQRSSPAPLTFKDGRRTSLTDAGRALAHAAIAVEVAFERAEQAVAVFQSQPTGSVTVAAFHSAGLALFGALAVSANGPEHPDVALTDFDVAQEGFPALTIDHDLVIAHRLAGSPPWPVTLRIEPLLFEPLDLVVRRDHPLATRVSIEPADLSGETWVAVHEGFPLERAVSTVAAVGGGEARILHRINDFSVAASVVAATGCVALLPRYTADLRGHPELVLRPLALGGSDRRIGLGRHIDVLARPETLERANAVSVLATIRSITAGLAARHEDARGANS